MWLSLLVLLIHIYIIQYTVYELNYQFFVKTSYSAINAILETENKAQKYT